MLPDFERAEAQNNNARPKYCGYGQLLDSVCCQVEQNSSNAIKYIVFMIMASCPTVSMPKGKVLTLGGITR